MANRSRRGLNSHWLITVLFFLASCTAEAPTPIFVTATPGPVGISIETITGEAPVIPLTAAAPFDPFSTPIPSATPVPFKILNVCLPYEPASLYEYAALDRDTAWARSVILETLRDGPIDHRNFEYQPVLLEKLPNLDDGSAVINAVTVREGETIVDARGNLTVLVPGVRYFDPQAVEQTYNGGGSLQAMQMTVTFRLKDGLKWEDGAPLTADDFLYGWQIAKDPLSDADHYIFNRMLDPQVIDARTLRLTYLPGYKDTLYYTRLPLPLPRHRYGQALAAQLAADDNANRRPLSYGPFVLQEWAPGDHLTVSKNPHYHRAAENLPKLNQIIFRFAPDADYMLKLFASGHCDLGFSSPTGEAYFTPQMEAIRQAEAQGLLTVKFVAGVTFEHLDFNLAPASGYRGLASANVFQDVRVRQAFAYCIDRRALINSLLFSRGELPSAYIPLNHPYFDARLITFYPFDPGRGRALLQEAGWRDTNNDGVVDRNGRFSADYVFGPTGNPLRAALAAALQTQLLQNCGIEIKPRELSRADLFGDFPDGTVFGRQYDLAQFAWVGGDSDPSCGLYTRAEWTGLGDGQPDQYGVAGYPGGGNSVGYLNPTFDEACARALASLDLAEKRQYHQQAIEIFSEEVPSLILFFRPRLALVRPTVFGFSLDSTHESVLWDVEAIDITP